MSIECKIELPVGPHPRALDLPHFPTRLQAVIWRNWELVSVERLAGLLRTDAAHVLELAAGLGLRVPPVVGKHWLDRGYVTLIRSNWHLLPYEQLLELLGWPAEKMDYALREDDFLFIKLGNLKPQCEPLYYRPLTEEQIRQTTRLQKLMEKHFSDCPGREEPQYGFIDTYRQVRNKAPASQTKSRFDLRFIYPYFALYGDPLIDPKLDPFPEGLLATLADMGINGVWMQGVLYTLIEWQPAPEMSAGHEKRIETLRILAGRAAKNGIGLYLYLNEPRAMPLKFFEKHPEWKGVEYPSLGVATVCTSHPPVLDLLRKNTEDLFRKVPELAGVFTITMSENPTNCYAQMRGKECPRCSKRLPAEVVAEVGAAIEEGVHRAKPEARVIAWNWGWHQFLGMDGAKQIVDRLPESVEVMCTSEEAMPTNVGGIKGSIVDYSISQVGPGEYAKELWRYAIDRGHKAVAKVQLNNTWECSALPYIPAVDLVEKHLDQLSNCGVTGLMASWTLGGYPGGNLELLTYSSQDLAWRRYGKKAAPLIQEAWALFSRGFTEFPFDCGVAYLGPHNAGPMNLVWPKPTGYHATMVGFPYDDLRAWRGPYPEDIFEGQFQKLSEIWKQGLEVLDRVKALIEEEYRANFEDLERVATAVYCHFRSVYLQVAFVRLRDGKDENKESRMIRILDEEIELAKTLYRTARVDSRIGFEASNHYAYTLNDLKEKVLNCDYVRQLMKKG
jgi:hypothetical protein